MNARASRGFTLVEMMVVVLILGILFRAALPNFVALKRDAVAARAVSELNVVREAAMSCYAQTGTWPAERPEGTIPPELVSHLPHGFTFEHNDYQINWENWTLPDGLPEYPATRVLVGVSITTHDVLLGRTVVNRLKSAGAAYTIGDSYTLPITTLEDP